MQIEHSFLDHATFMQLTEISNAANKLDLLEKMLQFQKLYSKEAYELYLILPHSYIIYFTM